MTETVQLASITASTPKYIPIPPRSPKTRPKTGGTIQDCKELQRLIMREAREAKGMSLGAIAKSYVALEILKLRVRMKPAPKPVDVQPRGKAKQPRSSFTESAGPIVVPSVPKPVEPGPTNTTS